MFENALAIGFFVALFFLGYKAKNVYGAIILSAIFSVVAVAFTSRLNSPLAADMLMFGVVFSLQLLAYLAGRLIGGKRGPPSAPA